VSALRRLVRLEPASFTRHTSLYRVRPPDKLFH
jgi:hypothetical protein